MFTIVPPFDVLTFSIPKLGFNLDPRGFNATLLNQDMDKELWPYKTRDRHAIVQWNFSYSNAGTMRGMHFQSAPYEQGKLVYVLEGHIEDGFIDLREDSTIYRQSSSVSLNSTDSNIVGIYIPPGYAHGFFAYMDSMLLYGLTNSYFPDFEECIHWSDIKWPKDITYRVQYLSKRDTIAPTLDQYLLAQSVPSL